MGTRLSVARMTSSGANTAGSRGSEPNEREWLEGLRYEDKFSCGCHEWCGDDGDVDGPGVCRGLPPERKPLVQIVMVPK